jgi:hypothetical protein
LVLEVDTFLETRSGYCLISGPDHSLVASKTVCHQSARGDDVAAEHCERLVPKAENLHRIGPVKIGSPGSRTIESGNKGNGGDQEITVDSLLRDLLFEAGAGLAAQGQVQIQQVNSSNRGRFTESAGSSALEFRARCNQTDWFAIT